MSDCENCPYSKLKDAGIYEAFREMLLQTLKDNARDPAEESRITTLKDQQAARAVAIWKILENIS